MLDEAHCPYCGSPVKFRGRYKGTCTFSSCGKTFSFIKTLRDDYLLVSEIPKERVVDALDIEIANMETLANALDHSMRAAIEDLHSR